MLVMFLGADVGRLAGTRFNPKTLIDGDQLMAEYFQWLVALPTRTADRQEDDLM